MDKYEYKLMAEEIVRLVGKKQYKAAASIADEIRWEKVKNVQMLCTVSEIYEKIGQYEESRDVLLLAYNRSPNGKIIVYRLVNLCIVLKDYQDATDFYHEYMQMAPNDPSILILKYKLYKARNAKLETLIAILEEFKEQDYQEEWILELARLYHQAGDGTRCVELCDEIDLWFNKGNCVIQALELKKLHEPLTALQENKLYNREEFLNDKPKEVYREPKKVNKDIREPKKVNESRGAKPANESGRASVSAKATGNAGEVPSVDISDPLAEALIKLARREKTDKKEQQLKKGFSILPKEDSEDVDELDLGAVENIDDVAQRGPLGQEDVPKDTIDKTEQEDSQLIEEQEEDSRGIFGKMFSRFRMEDDEMDGDFDDNDAYVEDDFNDEYPESEEENSRDAEIDFSEERQEDEYEYIYGDEDDEDEYEDIEVYEEEDEYEDEEAYGEIATYEDEEAYGEEAAYEDEEAYGEIATYEDEEAYGEEAAYEDEEAYGEEAAYEDEEAYGKEAAYEDEETFSETSQMTQEELMQSYVSKYDTLNLQKELAKSIQQLMDATEKETVDSTLENVKRMVERSNIPELTETMRFKAIRGNMLNKVAKKQAAKLMDGKDIEEVVMENAASAELDPLEDATVSLAEARPKPVAELAIKLKPVEEESIPIDRILTQEGDGQISMIIPEEIPEEEQVEGQLNLQDVLREWEKQELLSENDKEKRALEEARKRALEETQEIMSEIMELLKDVIPKIGSIKDGEEKMSVLAESLERVQKSLPLSQGIIEAAEESKEAASAIEAACEEAVMALEQLENSQEEDMVEQMEEAILAGLPEGIEMLAAETAEGELVSDVEEAEAESDSGVEAELISDVEEAEAESDSGVEAELISDVEEAEAESDSGAEAEADSTQEEQMALYSLMKDGKVTEVAEEMMPGAEVEMDNEQLLNDVTEAEWEKFKESFMEQAWEEKQRESAEEEKRAVAQAEVAAAKEPVRNQYEQFKVEQEDALDEEQKGILSYFLSIKGIAPMLERIVKQTEHAPEHMIITGEDGCGKTSIAMRIIKAAQVNKVDKVETIAKIQAPLLNQKDIYTIFDKVNGGVLIIERAGDLSRDTINKIMQAFYTNKYYVQLIFLDKKKYMDALLQRSESFINDIQMRLDLPVYTNHELVEFSKTYAAINGYSFDGMALLALYSLVELFQSDQHIASLEDMKNIMNEAMERADKRNNKLFGRLFGRKKADEKVLLESDFE